MLPNHGLARRPLLGPVVLREPLIKSGNAGGRRGQTLRRGRLDLSGKRDLTQLRMMERRLDPQPPHIPARSSDGANVVEPLNPGLARVRRDRQPDFPRHRAGENRLLDQEILLVEYGVGFYRRGDFLRRQRAHVVFAEKQLKKREIRRMTDPGGAMGREGRGGEPPDERDRGQPARLLAQGPERQGTPRLIEENRRVPKQLPNSPLIARHRYSVVKARGPQRGNAQGSFPQQRGLALLHLAARFDEIGELIRKRPSLPMQPVAPQFLPREHLSRRARRRSDLAQTFLQ